MGYILRMGWRNLRRSRARTILSLGAVALGVMVVILFKGYVDGFIDTFLSNSININSGHVRVVQEEYRKKERLLSLVYPVDGFHHEGYQGMIEEFEKVSGVTRVYGRIRFAALISKGENNQGVMGIGVIPDDEEATVKLSRYIDQGRFIRKGEKGIVLGKQLLDKLGIKVGDKATFLTNDSFGSIKAATYTVVGRLNSGLTFLDEAVAYVPLDRAQSLLGLEGAVTEIVAFGRDENAAAQIQQGIQEILKKNSPDQNYMAIPWYQHNGVVAYTNNAKAAMFILYAFVVLLACFVVLNTFIMIVSERKREIGMLGAMGLNRKEIIILFMAEAATVGFLGSLIGMGVGSFFNWWLSVVGLDLSAYTKTMGSEMLFFSTMYPKLSWGTGLFAFFLGWAVTILAAIIPARQAAKVEPTEALRSI